MINIKWFYKFEQKFNKFAIPNLMFYIIMLNVAGFVIRMISPDFFYEYLVLDVSKVLEGQVWRLVTFLMQPLSGSSFWIIFKWLLYYVFGRTIERVWGAFRFNMFYFTGIIGNIIAAFVLYFVYGYVAGPGSAYINESLYIIYGFLLPNAVVYLYFAIPIKVRWLSYLYLGYILYDLFISPWPVKIAILVSLANMFFYLFIFMKNKVSHLSVKNVYRKQDFKMKTKVAETGYKKEPRHKCAVCGRTEDDGEDLEFRYCSKCNGNYEYCQDHLFTHQHIE